MRLWSYLLVLCVGAVCGEEVVVSRAARELDLTSHLVKQSVSLTVLNEGERPLTSLLYTLEPVLGSKLAYIGAQVMGEGEGEEGEELVVRPTTIKDRSNVTAFRIELPPLPPKESTTVTVEMVFSHAIIPHPREITQSDRQLVQFTGNAYIFLPYPCKTQSTTVLLPSSNVESFSRISPVSTEEKELTYGPYADLPPYAQARMTIHYENNGPFIVVATLERVIEISHWGNIAVEEHVHIKHIGATLKGPFSRYDFQRNPNSGQAAVRSYRTLLPASAKDVYYRDEIGNISTSHLRETEDFVDLELYPRFPLFGGWQSRYYIGYNVPSYEYLYHSGRHHLLQMRVVDHVFDDQLIQQATVKIILPEGARNIVLKPPYAVTEYPLELHHTYLDTIGRPVVTAAKENLVEQHVQDFELHYDFERVLLLQEPLLVVVALYLFFLLVIVLVRLDFSITKDAALLVRQQVSVIMDSILLAHDQRLALVSRYQDSITAYKQSKDARTFKSGKRSLDDKYKSYTEEVSSLCKQLQGTDADSNAKVAELQRKCGELKAVLDESCLLAERVVSERMGKQQYMEQDRATLSRMTRLRNEIDTIVQTL